MRETESEALLSGVDGVTVTRRGNGWWVARSEALWSGAAAQQQ